MIDFTQMIDYNMIDHRLDQNRLEHSMHPKLQPQLKLSPKKIKKKKKIQQTNKQIEILQTEKKISGTNVLWKK